MKDVYEHLNDIDMNVSQFEEEEVSEAEREKVKMQLKRKNQKAKACQVEEDGGGSIDFHRNIYSRFIRIILHFVCPGNSSTRQLVSII